MITLFSLPKAFRGHSDVIQRNAIKSWTLLNPQPEILLCGDDEGTEQVAHEYGVKYMGPVRRNDFGTPLIQDLFQKARDHSATETSCYINSDIILLNDFMDACLKITSSLKAFIMTGQRWNLDIRKPLDFTEGWQQRLVEAIDSGGQLEPPNGLDYFVFPRSCFPEMPAFAIGRPMWDNWLLYNFRLQKLPVVDATRSVRVVHQRHDYSHVPGGTGLDFEGPEAAINRELAGGYERAFTLLDRTHWLTVAGLEPVRWWQNCIQQVKRYPVLHADRKLKSRIIRHILWRAKRFHLIDS